MGEEYISTEIHRQFEVCNGDEKRVYHDTKCCREFQTGTKVEMAFREWLWKK
jgi:hypothetical protein